MRTATAGTLARDLLSGRVVHAYLFAGPDGTGKQQAALHLACCLNCVAGDHVTTEPCGQCAPCLKVAAGNHPDLHRLEPEEGKNEITKEPAVEWLRNLHLARAEGRYRVGIIEQADLMNPTVANRLLKFIEEPPPQTVLILLTAREFALLPTLRSRVRRVRFTGPPPDELARRLQAEHQLSPEQARICAALAGSDPGLARSLAAEPQLWDLRDQLVKELRDLAVGDEYQAFQMAGAFSQNSGMALRQRLTLLISLLRDAVLLASAGEGSAQAAHLTRGAIHHDRLAQLQQLLQRADKGQLLLALRSLMAVPRLLDANANSRLTFEVVLLRLQRSFQGRRALIAPGSREADPLLSGRMR